MITSLMSFSKVNYNGDYFIAYWYPQVAVYDDVFGWDKIQYSGSVEFYNDFNNEFNND